MPEMHQITFGDRALPRPAVELVHFPRPTSRNVMGPTSRRGREGILLRVGGKRKEGKGIAFPPKVKVGRINTISDLAESPWNAV